MGRRSATTRLISAAAFDDLAARDRLRLDDGQRRAADALASGAGGIYLTGPAGRGKTWLLDAFCTLSPGTLRLHWHEFIRDLHPRLNRYGGLEAALDDLLTDTDALCFDELHVDDPADGIFLDGLVRAALTRGVRLIFTSNQQPSELMPNPLFHSTFQPTIDLLENVCTVLDLDAGVDYRERSDHDGHGFRSGTWMVRPPAADHPDPVSVDVSGRCLLARSADDGHLRVSFGQICGSALSATDYLALADRFTRWTVDEVPDLADTDRESALRLVHLVDVLYERDHPLTIISAVPRSAFGHAAPRPPGVTRLRSRLSALRPVDDAVTR